MWLQDPEVVELVRDVGVLLEVSVTSNWLTNAVGTIEEHPVRALWQQGVEVCINTDGPGVYQHR